jgi:hypothetical protein
MILDALIFVAVSIFCVSLIVLLAMQRKARIEIMDKYVLAEIEKAAILNKLQEILEEKDIKKLEESDGFLKFVSDSRDWAFKYIEDVQEAISKFSAKIEKEINYVNTYGSAVDSPHVVNINRIEEAYKELMELLPKEDQRM